MKVASGIPDDVTITTINTSKSNDHLAELSITSNKISCNNMCMCLPDTKNLIFPSPCS